MNDTKKGITVAGVPLEDFLQEEEQEKEKKRKSQYVSDAMGERATSIIVHRRNCPPLARGVRYQHNLDCTTMGTARIATRGRSLDPDEIRKEYGLKMKPTGSKIKDALWLLKNRGRLTTDELVAESDYGKRTAQTQLWRFSRVLEGIHIDSTCSPKEYVIESNLRRKTVDEIYEMYLQGMRNEYAVKQRAKKEKEKPIEPEEVVVEPEPIPEIAPKPHFEVERFNHCPICGEKIIGRRENFALNVILYIHHSTTYQGTNIRWTEVNGCSAQMGETT